MAWSNFELHQERESFYRQTRRKNKERPKVVVELCLAIRVANTNRKTDIGNANFERCSMVFCFDGLVKIES